MGLPKAFFMNSMPKSGTHLMKLMLMGLPSLSHHYQNELYEGYPVQYLDHSAKLSKLKSGEFGAGHIYHSEGWAQILRELKMKQLFLYRDPRDIVVSYAHFIIDKYPYHHLHPYLKECKTWKERYLAFIIGVRNPQIQYPSIGKWIDQFTGWLSDPSTMSIRFEDLVLNRDSLRGKLEEIILYLWDGKKLPMPLPVMIRQMEESSAPQKSLTFRSGKIGNWRSVFDAEVKQRFKEVAGQHLIQLGYEKNYNW
jgi:hypothetical protein